MVGDLYSCTQVLVQSLASYYMFYMAVYNMILKDGA